MTDHKTGKKPAILRLVENSSSGYCDAESGICMLPAKGNSNVNPESISVKSSEMKQMD
ncbi:hypothetical protein P4H61_25015 [Paenibacillus peoriae]|uniref:hypothetical protein n=1 Tax=Paenibacillus peoriae TaxID=59893 RepID=UPI00145D0E7F|nr:hypothetical protein [Paenibacillus peoriae]MEC0184739.1 hypothetical protein [Paenibacillus peoriae]